MASGIAIHSNCSIVWNDMKLGHKHRFITFKIEKDAEIVVDATGPKDAAYDLFKKALPADDCRYGLLEVPGTTKIVFVMWAPDTSPVKAKMIYASTRQVIQDKLSGHHKTLQASDLGDVDEAKMKKLVS